MKLVDSYLKWKDSYESLPTKSQLLFGAYYTVVWLLIAFGSYFFFKWIGVK